MNLVNFGMMTFILNVGLTIIMGFALAGPTAIIDSTDVNQIAIDELDQETGRFNKEMDDFQEIGKREEAGSISEIEGALAIGKGIGSIGDFISSVFKDDFLTMMEERGKVNATIMTIIRYMYLISVFTVLVGFIIGRLRK